MEANIEEPLMLYDEFVHNAIPLTDSHCHLSLVQEQNPHFLEQLYHISQKEDIMILDIGLSPQDLEYRKRITQHIPQVYYTVGMHPCKSQTYTVKQLVQELEIHVNHAIAIGEIGLDWYRMYSDKAHQIALFEVQIGLARKYQKPIIIHSRESLDDIIELVKKWHPQNGNKGLGIMHCFSGDKTQAKKCLDLGFYISFAGNLSYNSSTLMREVASYVPIEFLLTETDSPYLIHKNIQKIIKNNKKRYARLNSPTYLFPLIETLADAKNTSCDYIAHHTRTNLTKILNL